MAARSTGSIKDSLTTDLPPEVLAEYETLRVELDKLKEQCKEFSFLAAGKTGVGKSTLLNALNDTTMFKSAACRREAGTKIISKYQQEKNGITITAWDSPGFEDSSGFDVIYKDEMVLNCYDVDVIIYCISLKERRATNLAEHNSALKKITEALGADAWKKGVIVLTCANTLQKQLELENRGNVEVLFSEKIAEWKREVQKALRAVGVEDSVAESIPVVPAGHYKRMHLPGIQHWLSNVWLIIYRIVNMQAQLALQQAAAERFRQDGSISANTDIVVKKDFFVLVGALIGALAIGIPTFGLAGGIGMVMGGTVGKAMSGIANTIKEIKSKRISKSTAIDCDDRSLPTTIASTLRLSESLKK